MGGKIGAAGMGAGAVMTAGWNTGGAAMSSEGTTGAGVGEAAGAGPRSAPIKTTTRTVVRATNGAPT